MPTTVAFVHTSAVMIPVFKSLAQELLTGVTTFNMVDESLLCDIVRQKGLPPGTAKRLVGHVLAAEGAGADYVLVTCSSMGRAVEASRVLCRAPVLRVDEPMADQAIRVGRRIGVIATLPSTLEPTVDLIHRRAASVGVESQVKAEVVDGAFDAVMAGRGEEHDARVTAALRRLASQVDVIVLAQASMARVVEALALADKPVPILSSPRSAVEHLAALIAK